MAKMFDEQENYYFETFNDWHRGFIDDSYSNVKKVGWEKRFKYFVCLKNESLDDLANRYTVLIEFLKEHEIRLSDIEKVSKFADALPVVWDECLKNLKRDSSFSKFYLKEFINKLKKYKSESEMKKKELINEIEKNLMKVGLNVILEIKRRISVCLAAKSNLIYDNKRGCYIDENANPLDFVKIFLCRNTQDRERSFKERRI
ncbi:hypothetical protein Hanom_Chr12g01144091 [Helianthus anomalus]